MLSRLCGNTIEAEQAQVTDTKWLLISSKDAEALGTGNHSKWVEVADRGTPVPLSYQLSLK